VSRLDLAWLTAQPIAHRGLHDANRSVPENSLAAFSRAIEHGFAIECDLHLSSDRVPVVFHDATLERMCGDLRHVDEVSAEELISLPLAGSAETIPSLSQMLAVVNGSVPIIAELKGTDADSDQDFIERLRPLVETYSGPLALMSFDEWLVRKAAETFGARLPVGLTAEGTRPEELERHSALFAGRCGFTSYNVHHLPNAFTDDVRGSLGLPVISWTVRTPDEVTRSTRHADQMTFEGFVPDA
jgi:glycerophosphoryl diester phosphodiesterase